MRHSTTASRIVVGGATLAMSTVLSLGLSLGLSGVAVATPLQMRETAVAHASVAKPDAVTAMTSNLHRLRVCESGDNYREDSGNGYFGAYQFAPSTWHALGYKGRPDLAKSATQNLAARKLHAKVGWTAWPACARSQHLN